MTPEEFDYIRELLKKRSGLVLGDEKRYLIESRLMPVVRDEGMETLGDLVVGMKAANSEELRAKVTQAMTINESFFFRDKTPFENFKEIIVPAMLASSRASSRSMRIWCAAASTGQEPYSLAIQIREMEDQLRGWNIEIIATDLSEEVLEKAKSGLYSQFEVQRGLPIQLMVKYFKQTGSLWQIDSSIRSMVKYQHFNLLEDYTPLGTFDIIFCRNVLIYFDPPTKTDMLSRMAQRMRPDGFLALGAAETVIGISDEFKTVSGARGLYALDAGEGKTSVVPVRTAMAAQAPAASLAAAKPAAPVAATAAIARPAVPAASPALATAVTARPAAHAASPALAIAATARPAAPAITPAPAASAIAKPVVPAATPASALRTPVAPAAVPAVTPAPSMAKPLGVKPALAATPAAPAAPISAPARPVPAAAPAAPAASTAPARVPPATPAPMARPATPPATAAPAARPATLSATLSATPASAPAPSATLASGISRPS